MMLQSYAGFIEIFPAIPRTWLNLSFNTLRAEGAFLVSAKKENGVVTEVKIFSEKGGNTKLKLPFKTLVIDSQKNIIAKDLGDGFMTLNCKPGGEIILSNGYE